MMKCAYWKQQDWFKKGHDEGRCHTAVPKKIGVPDYALWRACDKSCGTCREERKTAGLNELKTGGIIFCK